MQGYPRNTISWGALWALLALPLTGVLQAEDPFAGLREQMVAEQIASRGIRNPDVLRVMRTTPRHLFLPFNLRSSAYEDHPIPIGFGATISQPYIVALMTDLLAPAAKHRILEIGTGSGYQAAILGQLAKEVYSIEIIPELARSASQTLQSLGYANVQVRQGDGYAGWPERAPFDGIILTAAPPEIPAALIDQVSPGGRLVAPVGMAGRQELVVINKRPDGTVNRRSAGPVLFVPMRGPGK